MLENFIKLYIYTLLFHATVRIFYSNPSIDDHQREYETREKGETVTIYPRVLSLISLDRY